MYRRNLPHWYPDGAAVFVTWRLFGSLPRARLACSPGAFDGRAFLHLDRQMERAEHGPIWLRDDSVAECVARTIEAAEAERHLCTIHSFVVTPNHVHLLISPSKPLCEVTQWIKGVSARRANRLLDRTGEPFWQDESFDNWTRSLAEFETIRSYIARNPVRAGLVAEPEEWRYSTVSRRAQTEALCHSFARRST